MPKFYILLFCFLIVTIKGFSQSGWHEWEVIYNDNNIIVELQLYYSDNSCEHEGRPFKYRTRITGELRNSPYFLNWTLDYKDCKGSIYYQHNSIEIGKYGGGTVNNLIQESMENRFKASSLENKFYNVAISDSAIRGAGIKEILTVPISIISEKDTLAGGYVLKVIGDPLHPGTEWVWYESECGRTRIGSGESIKIQPSETTTFFVRSESKTKHSECVQVLITVEKKQEPVPTSPRVQEPINAINTAEAPEVKLKKERPIRYFENAYYKQSNKFLHIGIGGGIDYHQFAENSKYSIAKNAEGSIAYSPSNNSMQGLGFVGELGFHPIIKNHFSLGINTSLAAGKSPLIFNNNKGSLNDGSSFTEDYSYSRINLGGELAFGLKSLKFLAKANRAILTNNYKITFTTNSFTASTTTWPTFYLDKAVTTETIGAGFRLGSYSGKNSIKRGNTFDLTYNLKRDATHNKSIWNGGFGLGWWYQSVFKLQFDMAFPPPPDIQNSDPDKYRNINYQFSLIYNRNWFY